MVAKVQIKRTSTQNSPPVGLVPGELAVEMDNPFRVWVGVPVALDPAGMKQINVSGAVVIADTAPLAPTPGMLWWESDTGILWLWYVDIDGAQWVQAAGSVGGGSSVTVGDAPPAAPANGDLWWESDTAILWIWYVDVDSSQWVQAAGSTGGSGGTPIDAYTKTESDAKYVELAGDTMTGTLNIVQPGYLNVDGIAAIHLNGPASGSSPQIVGKIGGSARWVLFLGDGSAESGTNSGSDFGLAAYDDAGATIIHRPLTINRATGDTVLTGNVIIERATPVLYLSDNGGVGNYISTQQNGLTRWELNFGAVAFNVTRYDDAGAVIDNPLVINRATGNATFGGRLIVDNPGVAALDLYCGAASVNCITGVQGGLMRWSMYLGNADTDFYIQRFDDAGVAINQHAMHIDRATGKTTFGNSVFINGAADVGLVINKGVSGASNVIEGHTAGSMRWSINLGDLGPETGANAGANFSISSLADDGITALNRVMYVERATGKTSFSPLYGATSPTDAGVMIDGGLGVKLDAHFGGQINVALAANFYGGVNSVTTIVASDSIHVDNTTLASYWNCSSPGTIFSTHCAGVHVGGIMVSAVDTAFVTTSSADLKEDLKSFDAGNIVDNTNVYDFAWKSTGERAYGIVAQQAIEVYPQAITHTMNEDKTEWWGVDYSKYVPVLLQEMKAMRERMREMELKLSGLNVATPTRGR